jgi:uncharacterized protein (DUF1330 family)
VKTRLKLALAVLAGVSIGVSGAVPIHAQQTTTPPGHVIAKVEGTDPTTLQKYGEKAPQIVASFNGHYVVRGGDIQALEDEPPEGYIVVIGFDRVQKAREWYDSPACAAIRPFRQTQARAAYLLAKAWPPVTRQSQSGFQTISNGL